MFPQSIILCGVRDVRDYRIYSDREKTPITGGSAFNVKAKSLRMGNFSPDEIKLLYEQHTRETGQKFNNEIFPLVWDLTEGQPWLVNALAYETCFEMKEGRNREKDISPDTIIQAKENLILRRETHIHQLADKLKEDRVKHVIEPILVGSKEPEKLTEEYIDYVVDLGLIQKKPYLRIANRIYQEIIPRQLTYSTELTMTQEASWYVKDDGSLEKTIENGLEQTWQYMDKCGTEEGYLLVFDRSKKASWKEKIFKKEKTFKGTKITVYGM
jgi:hypothetical protein